MVCEGTLEDPCLAFMNFTANEDIFIYPTNYDPWGRNTPFDFSPNIESWKLYRSWGNGWRELPLNKSCTGTWCGLSDNDDERKFAVVFREGKQYQLMIKAYKNNPEDVIKWAAFDGVIDPYWYGVNKSKFISKPSIFDENTNILGYEEIDGKKNYKMQKVIGKTVNTKYQGKWYKIEDAPSLINSEFVCNVDGDTLHLVECLDYNYTSISLRIQLNKELIDDIKNKDTSLGKIAKDINVSEIPISVNDGFITNVDLSIHKQQDVVINFSIGDILKVGKNSTTIVLNTSLEYKADGTVDEETGGYYDAVFLMTRAPSGFFRNVLARYNITSIPQDVVIIDSSMVMKVSINNLDDDTEGYNVNVHHFYNQTWNDDEVTWNTRPNTSEEMNLTFSDNFTFFGGTGEPFGDIPWNVTDIVSKAYVDEDDYVSFYFNTTDVFGSPTEYDYIQYRRIDYNLDRPYLSITYSELDVNAPTYSNNSTNSTIADTDIEHRLEWDDDVELDGYIFSFCNGTWNGSDCLAGDSILYQESANVSVDGGGISTGNYNFTGANWINISNLSDGDWDTAAYSASLGIGNNYFYVNYTKPRTAIDSSLWLVKDTVSEMNLTIPSECWSQDPLRFRVYAFVGGGSWGGGWQCWNTTSNNWVTLRTDSSILRAYEEAMNWKYLSTLCYQETANITTECGGLDTGNYSFSDNWYTENELYDADWNESTGGYVLVGNGTGIFFINYSKPTGALDSSLWEVLANNMGGNYSLLDCWDAYADKVVLRINTSQSPLEKYVMCYNSTNWIILDNHTGSGSRINEEAMRWNISTAVIPFENDSFVEMSGLINWSNVTKHINSDVGMNYSWCVYANDTNNNWNDSCASPFTYLSTGIIDINFSIWNGSNWIDSGDDYLHFRCTSTQKNCEPTNQNVGSSQSIYQICNNGTDIGTVLYMHVNETFANIDLVCDDDYTVEGVIILNTSNQTIHGELDADVCTDVSCWVNYSSPTSGGFFNTYVHII